MTFKGQYLILKTMATTKEFLSYFFEQVKNIPEVASRAMMGEYVLYYKGKVIGGIYDNRVLIKPVDGLDGLLPDAELQIPYPGAKPLVYLESFEEERLKEIFGLLYSKLPQPKKKKV